MEHQFNIEVASIVGVIPAILYKNIAYWAFKNKTNEKHFYDGEYWSYNSIKAFKDQFPYLSDKQIRTALDKLIDEGWIGVGNYNSSPYDRTKWYCDLRKFDLPKSANGKDQEGKCITNNKPDSKPIVVVDEENKKLRSLGVFDSIEDAINEMKSNQEWKASYGKQSKIENPKDCDKWIDLYKEHAIASGKTSFNLKDLKSHCLNWTRKRIQSGAKLPVVVDKNKKHIPNISHLQFH